MSIDNRNFTNLKIGDFPYDVERGSTGEDTVDQYLWVLKRFDKFLDDNGLELTFDSFDKFITHLQKEGKEKATQVKYYWIIKRFMEYKGFDDIEKKVTPPKSEGESVSEEDYPSPKDCKKLVREIPKKTFWDIRDKAIISTIFSSGARRGEVAKLNKTDFDPPELVITREKTRGRPSKRRRKIDSTTVNLIENYIEKRVDDNKALFITYGRLGKSKKARRITGGAIYRIVEKWSEAILNKSYSPHKLRHSRATQLAKAGQSMKYVADFLGITVQTADRVYSHLSKEDFSDVPPAL